MGGPAAHAETGQDRLLLHGTYESIGGKGAADRLRHLAASGARAAAMPQVVVKGLNNPRQLFLGGGGGLYIAEAGRGGDTCVGDEPEQICFSETGAGRLRV